MTFLKEYEQFKRELDGYYSETHIDLDSLKSELDVMCKAMSDASPYRQKALTYEFAQKQCDVKVFRHCPFYYEIIAGRPREQWGFGGIGEWMKSRKENKGYFEKCASWKKTFSAIGLLNGGGSDIDFDHHTIGYDNVLKLGFNGIIKQCENRLEQTNNPKQREFLESVIIGYRSLIGISEKFSDKANYLLKSEEDTIIRKRLELIRDTAKRVPAEAPQTFYEALNTIIFIREVIGSLEGIAVSTYGMLDRMLEPFYKRDLEAGLITKESARDLLSSFLAITDVKHDVNGFTAPKDGSGGDHVETSTTAILGGCDQHGVPVYNELTEMIFDIYTELKLMNPKLNARISAAHPQAYFENLAKFAATGSNILSIYNDDVLIPASVKAGKALEDVRLYVGGGCQENILQNCATHSRATLWINLCGILNMTLMPDKLSSLVDKYGLQLADASKAKSFDSLYLDFLNNLKTVARTIISNRNENEQKGWQINPCPIHSATLDGCIDKALDWTEGGAKYSDGALDCVGTGSLIDSLYALKTVVYDLKDKTLSEFLEILQNDYQDEENFRQYLLNSVPKFGHDNDAIKEFSAKVFKDVAAATSGYKNSRGGTYEASLFAFRSFVSFGSNTGATPDGRQAGQRLSPSMSPSILSLGEKCSASQILNALEPVNLTDYPILGVLDMKLPCNSSGQGKKDILLITSVIKRFINTGGSGLQLNMISPDTLNKAITEPEAYSDVTVRISGYSAYFTRLPEKVQHEVMERTLSL